MTLAPDDLQGGDYARLVRLGEPPQMIGHDASEGYTATVDGQSVTIEWGATVQVSTSVDGPGDDSASVPRVSLEVAKSLARNDQLESVT